MILGLIAYMAYSTKSLDIQYRESDQITVFLAVLIITLALVVSIGLTSTSPNSSLVLRSMAVWFLSNFAIAIFFTRRFMQLLTEYINLSDKFSNVSSGYHNVKKQQQDSTKTDMDEKSPTIENDVYIEKKSKLNPKHVYDTSQCVQYDLVCF
jgi:hypothetical protein